MTASAQSSRRGGETRRSLCRSSQALKYLKIAAVTRFWFVIAHSLLPCKDFLWFSEDSFWSPNLACTWIPVSFVNATVKHKFKSFSWCLKYYGKEKCRNYISICTLLSKDQLCSHHTLPHRSSFQHSQKIRLLRVPNLQAPPGLGTW